MLGWRRRLLAVPPACLPEGCDGRGLDCWSMTTASAAIPAVNKGMTQDHRIWRDHVHLFSRRSTELALERARFVEVEFLKEKGFKRSMKGEMIHRLLRTADVLTCGTLDLTASWVVRAR